jgi:hypothetical protein
LVITISWTHDFIDYIKENKLPANKEEATRIIQRSKNYVLMGDNLYRRAASLEVLLKCVSSEKDKEILDEIYSACCENHLLQERWSVKHSALDSNWPTALKDAEELVRKCKGCQMFAKTGSHPSAQSHLHLACLAVLLLGARSSRTSQKS